jgi:hypothetical protein
VEEHKNFESVHTAWPGNATVSSMPASLTDDWKIAYHTAVRHDADRPVNTASKEKTAKVEVVESSVVCNHLTSPRAVHTTG